MTRLGMSTEYPGQAAPFGSVDVEYRGNNPNPILWGLVNRFAFTQVRDKGFIGSRANYWHIYQPVSQYAYMIGGRAGLSQSECETVAHAVVCWTIWHHWRFRSKQRARVNVRWDRTRAERQHRDDMIVILHSLGRTQREIAAEVETSKTTVQRVVNGQSST